MEKTRFELIFCLVPSSQREARRHKGGNRGARITARAKNLGPRIAPWRRRDSVWDDGDEECLTVRRLPLNDVGTAPRVRYGEIRIWMDIYPTTFWRPNKFRVRFSNTMGRTYPTLDKRKVDQSKRKHWGRSGSNTHPWLQTHVDSIPYRASSPKLQSLGIRSTEQLTSILPVRPLPLKSVIAVGVHLCIICSVRFVDILN